MNPRHEHHDHDDRPQAVQHAEAGAEAWVAAVRHQRTATPDHSDFYALGADLVATMRAVQDLARLLDDQVQRYGEHRPVYDDSRDDVHGEAGVVDPHARLTAAAVELEALTAELGAAIWSADRFWNAISHIGVEDTSTGGIGAGVTR